LRWLQKQDDDDDEEKSRTAAGREFQAAGPQNCATHSVKVDIAGSLGRRVKTNVERNE